MTNNAVQPALADQLASHIVQANEIPSDVAELMEMFIIDHLALCLAGLNRSVAQAARASIIPLPEPQSGSVFLLGTTTPVSPIDAAFIGGISSHSLELDDTHEGASLHPGVAVLPTLFALGQHQPTTLFELVRAATVGYDVVCSLGMMLGAAESYGRGFHPTGVVGAVGSAAAACKLLSLNHDQTRNALAVAANLAAGSLEFLSDGSWTKPLNAGQAAATGIRAAQLGAAGFNGPVKAFEGRDGFFFNYGAGPVPGRELEISLGLGARETSIKLYPCCRYMHGNLDLLLELVNAKPEIQSAEIVDVELAVIKAGARLVSEPAADKVVASSPVEAQFSMPFGAALALETGQATLTQFDDAHVLGPRLRPLMEKVRSVTVPWVEDLFPASWAAQAKVTLASGETFTSETSAFLGSPANPVNRSDVRDKAAGLLDPDVFARLGAAEAMLVENPTITNIVDALKPRTEQGTADS